MTWYAILGTACVVAVLTFQAGAQESDVVYEPNWASLDARPIPEWFADAKFGIFIHWGIYSVPSWAPKGTYSEWYWNAMKDKNGETWKFHERVYGPNFKYEEFAPLFKAELYDPAAWADLFARAGARYVVPTSKHHDGYCLWPSKEAGASWGRAWNSKDAGPKRDLLGELTEAVRAKGLKMGFYYSLYEWYNPIYMQSFDRYRDLHFFPQFKDVVTRYQPSIIFADGEWDHTSEEWRTPELLAWLFNESPCKNEVVINDRWGKDCRSVHGGYFTTEYGEVGGGKELADQRVWEENRGIGASFGYNRNESIEDYMKPGDIVHLLIRTVAKGGNLLLDIGPAADGTIPVIMQERLLEVGAWLDVNGEAIYGTRAWRAASESDNVWYTAKDGAVYALCLTCPDKTLTLATPKAAGTVSVQLLGCDAPVSSETTPDGLVIAVPQLPSTHAYVFKLTGVE